MEDFENAPLPEQEAVPQAQPVPVPDPALPVPEAVPQTRPEPVPAPGSTTCGRGRICLSGSGDDAADAGSRIMAQNAQRANRATLPKSANVNCFASIVFSSNVFFSTSKHNTPKNEHRDRPFDPRSDLQGLSP